MKRLLTLIILWFLLQPFLRPVSGALVHAQVTSSDWPSLNYDGTQSNDNTAEKTLTAQNVLKLKVRWTAPTLDVSYPIVAGGHVYIPVLSHGRVHVRALDAATGKFLTTFPKDARGGMLALGSSIYLAGHIVQEVDPTTGDKLSQIKPRPAAPGGSFVNPITDQSIMVAGYTGSLNHRSLNSLYGIDPQSNSVLWKLPSLNAAAALGAGRVLTETTTGSEFVTESNGKSVASQTGVWSDWFTDNSLAYTVATVKRSKATLYAYSASGRRVWQRVVGPYMITSGWPHATTPSAIYVQTMQPQSSIVALAPGTGHVLWARTVASIQRLVLANGLLFVLTYSLGQPARVVILRAQTGQPLGAIVLSPGYFAFNEPNGLMVADGMVFIRAVGPGNVSLLIALGLPGST